MIKIANRIFWKVISLLLLFLSIFIIWQWSINEWTGEDIFEFLLTVAKYGIPGILFIRIIYKTYIERIILWSYRRKSAEVLAEELSPINQVSGAVRAGKDSSTVAASMIVKDYILRKERKELNKLEHDLYIYDFEKIKSWLDKNGKRFFVASDFRINIQFKKMIRENKCFIHDYWLKKVDPKEHYRGYIYKNGKHIPDVAFKDGIKPGGIHFLHLLKRYTLLYMYHYYVPNFVLSNQPILENYTVDKKTGKIDRLFSKIFSQDYLKLKEETPIPFPMRGFVIQTENAIIYSNTDKDGEKYFKDESGMREFYTTAGHLLREKVYLYDITQSESRTLKALRELYPGYQHVFQMTFKATSDFTRSLIRLRQHLKRFKILRLRLYRYIRSNTLLKLSFLKNKNKVTRLTKQIYRTKRKISRLSQKEARKWSKGYIIFYKGVYEHIRDVGRKVSFPRLGVIHESKKDTTSYQTYGFKQTVKITDCFSRYDTHFMYSIREAKEILQDMHFTEIANWESFKVTFEEIRSMNYKTFIEMMNVVIEKLKAEEKERKKRLKEIQNRKPDIPNLNKLSLKELGYLVKDFGIESKVNKASPTLKQDIMNLLLNQYKSFRKDVLV